LAFSRRARRGPYLRRGELDRRLALLPVIEGVAVYSRTIAALCGTGKSTIDRIKQGAMRKVRRRDPAVAAWLEGQ